MEQAILTDRQKAVCTAVTLEPALKDFYLTGGTALAEYYFRHRISDDLDFFTPYDPDTTFLRAFAGRLKKILGARSIHSVSENMRS